MTPPGVVALVERISFGWPFRAWQLRLSACLAWDGVLLTLHLDSPHRDTGKREPGGVVLTRMWNGLVLEAMSEQQVVRAVRLMAQEAALHEVDESLLVDGKRAFDPHLKGDGTP